MLDQLFIRRPVLSRLQTELFGAYLDSLADTLHQQGYARTTIRDYLYACDKFGGWLTQRGCSIADTSKPLIKRYICRLKRTSGTNHPKAGRGLSHLARLLQPQGIINDDPKEPVTEAERWLIRYDAYLDQVIGAAANTRDRYRTIIRRFLASRFGTGPVCWNTLTAADLSEFICQEVCVRRGFGRKGPGVAVRSLLRFLVFSGELQPGLEAAVPTVRQWQHATLPQRLTAEQVAQLLASCDTATPLGRRDRAILLLLARLGLRAGEVVQLRLDDIDWRVGQLQIQPIKTHRERCLPLPREVGEALMVYLLDGRPTSTSRIVFLSNRPPFAPFTGPTRVGWVVRRACRRAGFPPELWIGAHALRHSAASQMVCQGASFKAVADVLGHRSLQTTGIYAKLDLATLERVALPGP